MVPRRIASEAAADDYGAALDWGEPRRMTTVPRRSTPMRCWTATVPRRRTTPALRQTATGPSQAGRACAGARRGGAGHAMMAVPDARRCARAPAEAALDRDGAALDRGEVAPDADGTVSDRACRSGACRGGAGPRWCRAGRSGAAPDADPAGTAPGDVPPAPAAGQQAGDPSAASGQAQIRKPQPGARPPNRTAIQARGYSRPRRPADSPLGSCPSVGPAFTGRPVPAGHTAYPPSAHPVPAGHPPYPSVTQDSPGAWQRPAGPRPSAGAPGAPQPGPPAEPGSEPRNEPDRVIVVTGVPRYHRPGCILIRFLGKDDVESITREAAEASGCVPCRACQPDKLSSAAESGVTGWG